MDHRPRHMKHTAHRQATAAHMFILRVSVCMATISMSTGATIRFLGPSVQHFLTGGLT